MVHWGGDYHPSGAATTAPTPFYTNVESREIISDSFSVIGYYSIGAQS